MLLLDTVALIRMGTGEILQRRARKALRQAEFEGVRNSVSVATAWEACLLESRARSGITVGSDGETWFRNATKLFDLTVLPIDERIAVGSRKLPGIFHPDPADRFIVATAREYGLSIITTDRKILAYAAQGHVRAIEC